MYFFHMLRVGNALHKKPRKSKIHQKRMKVDDHFCRRVMRNNIIIFFFNREKEREKESKHISIKTSNRNVILKYLPKFIFLYFFYCARTATLLKSNAIITRCNFIPRPYPGILSSLVARSGEVRREGPINSRTVRGGGEGGQFLSH